MVTKLWVFLSKIPELQAWEMVDIFSGFIQRDAFASSNVDPKTFQLLFLGFPNLDQAALVWNFWLTHCLITYSPKTPTGDTHLQAKLLCVWHDCLIRFKNYFASFCCILKYSYYQLKKYDWSGKLWVNFFRNSCSFWLHFISLHQVNCKLYIVMFCGKPWGYFRTFT